MHFLRMKSFTILPDGTNTAAYILRYVLLLYLGMTALCRHQHSALTDTVFLISDADPTALQKQGHESAGVGQWCPFSRTEAKS